MTFARIKEAFASLPPQGNCFFVLTIDRNGYYSGERWADADTAYRELSRMSREFLRRLRRLCRARGWADPKNRWVATVEAHRSGWPHLNIVIHCPELAEHLASERDAAHLAGLTDHEARLLRGDVLECATLAGWGVQSSGERVRDDDAMAGYVTKLAKHADENVGELAKLTQAPLNAPVKFRRLRSGKGFLPPRHVSEWTGVLVRRVRTHGQPDARPMNPAKTLVTRHEEAGEWQSRCEHIDAALQRETLIWEDEERRTHVQSQVRRVVASYHAVAPVVTHYWGMEAERQRDGDLLADALAAGQ